MSSSSTAPLLAIHPTPIPPSLATTSTAAASKCTPNLLPCRFKAAVAVSESTSLWRPRKVKKSSVARGGGAILAASTSTTSTCTITTATTTTTTTTTTQEALVLVNGQDSRIGKDLISEKDEEIYETAFRGRRLLGKAVPVPEGYIGLVLSPTEITLPQTDADADADHSDGAEPESEPGESINAGKKKKVLTPLCTFTEMVLWGHDELPSDASAESVLRGVEEWVGWARRLNEWDAVEGEGEDMVMVG
ncbi:ribonuclease H2 non-catalytic subunit-domain-containing protein [Kalaharituber pfeilii]|nr:ribonuclease H2 non-catalytic subunit-domain-containing protein [Kalaharituber pfeilii]